MVDQVLLNVGDQPGKGCCARCEVADGSEECRHCSADQERSPVFGRLAMYGNSMSAMMPQYLEASMQAFQRNQAKFRETMEGAIGSGPFGEIARRNMEMFEAAASAFGGRPKPGGEMPAAAPAASRDDEVAALKAQLSEMQDKIDRLSD